MTLPQPQPTAWQQETGIDPTRAALIVVDVLGGHTEIIEPLRDMADQCIRLAHAARVADIPVIFACDEHLPGIDRELELWGEHSMRGTPDSRPLDGFDVNDVDYVLPKRRYSAFVGTDLDILLRELGRDILIVVGADTNICVLHTLTSAYYLGYRTIVPADATATFLIGTQDGGLEYFSRVLDARVVTTDRVIADIAATVAS